MAEDSKPEKETAGSPKNNPERRARGASRGRRGRGGRRHHGPRATERSETTADKAIETEGLAAAVTAPESEAAQPTSSDPDVSFAPPSEMTAATEPTPIGRPEEAEAEPAVEGDMAPEPSFEREAETERADDSEAPGTGHQEEQPAGQAAPCAEPMEQARAERPTFAPGSQQQQQFRGHQPQRQYQEQRSHGDRQRQFRDRPRQGAPATPPQPLPPPHQPASPATIQKAIEDVNRIIETLKETLDDMEEVLETLELAERQKTADEREIETLRRSLRHVQRPRENPVAGQPRH
jgi:hypothetical protein